MRWNSAKRVAVCSSSSPSITTSASSQRRDEPYSFDAYAIFHDDQVVQVVREDSRVVLPGHVPWPWTVELVIDEAPAEPGTNWQDQLAALLADLAAGWTPSGA
jgi:hypothetical protein